MLSDGIKVGGGMVASRAWGQGSVVWTPGAVQSQVYLPAYSTSPVVRRLLVGTSHVDQEGRLKQITIELDINDMASGAELKQMLLKHELFPLPGVDMPFNRLKLTVYGTELEDEHSLRSLAPTAEVVQARLLVRRRASTGGSPSSPVPTSLR